MSKRRKYSPEFKREAIALTRQPGVHILAHSDH
jgi:transposase